MTQNNQFANALAAATSQEPAKQEPAKQETSASPATQILAGMQNAVVGATMASKPDSNKSAVKEGYQSVHVSKIDGVPGIKQRGRWAWSKTMLKEDSPRLKALLDSGRVTKI